MNLWLWQRKQPTMLLLSSIPAFPRRILERTLRSPAILSKPAGSLARVVGKDNIGTRATYRRKDLHNDLPLVDPAVRGSRLRHRIFTTNIVGGQGQLERLTCIPNDVEISESWLDHDDIRP